MIIYNLSNKKLLNKRVEEAKQILEGIPAKHCFITGSFIYKEKYKDIDIFIISRSQKKFKSKFKNVKITIIDFNQLYSLFYQSISKACLAKGILPQRDLKVTLADYWAVINEVVPTLMNEKKFQKNIRFLVLYTEYFKTGEILDSFQLSEKVSSFKSTKEIIEYIEEEVPLSIKKRASFTYLKRFFYTQAAIYKEMQGYKAQRILYELTHKITRGNDG